MTSRGGRACRVAIAAVIVGAGGSCSSAPESSGASIDPGDTVTFQIYAHCGVQFLGVVNGRSWIADEPGSDAYNWIPDGWEAEPAEPYGSLTAELTVARDGSSITAIYRDRSVTYRPVDSVPLDLAACD